MTSPFGFSTFTYTREQVHSLVAVWKLNGKSISGASHSAELIWKHPLNLEWICNIVNLLERTAYLDAEGEPQDVAEDSFPDFWIIEALYNE